MLPPRQLVASIARWLPPRRAMAILPQRPQFSATDLRREEQLQRRILRAERATQLRLESLSAPPKFSQLKSTDEVLGAYEAKRPVLKPADTVAAFYALGQLTRMPAHLAGEARVARDPRFGALRSDVLASLPQLNARQLSNALQAAAYLQLRDATLLGELCSHSARRAETFALRDVVSGVYSLGRLRWRDEALARPLLERAEADVRGLHPIDLANLCGGLLGLGLAPRRLLGLR